MLVMLKDVGDGLRDGGGGADPNMCCVPHHRRRRAAMTTRTDVLLLELACRGQRRALHATVLAVHTSKVTLNEGGLCECQQAAQDLRLSTFCTYLACRVAAKRAGSASGLGRREQKMRTLVLLASCTRD